MQNWTSLSIHRHVFNEMTLTIFDHLGPFLPDWTFNGFACASSEVNLVISHLKPPGDADTMRFAWRSQRQIQRSDLYWTGMILNHLWTVWMYLLAFPTWTCHAVEVLAVCIAVLSQPCEGPRRQVQVTVFTHAVNSFEFNYSIITFLDFQYSAKTLDARLTNLLRRCSWSCWGYSVCCQNGREPKERFALLRECKQQFIAKMKSLMGFVWICHDLSLLDKTADGPYWPNMPIHDRM